MRQLTTIVDALKRDQDVKRKLSATVDTLKRIREMSKTKGPCYSGYTVFRGICYKVYSTPKSFGDAAAFCRQHGGTLAMPRDAETNTFLLSLFKPGQFWFGLRKEGRFKWLDGSALGTYNYWAPGQPNNEGGNQDWLRVLQPL
ncbi:lactose-binding lectin l-2-like [Branchiostoma floridae]|uniref:Lactose-binding lectin l-2-like n=2 Tax=Branchiostoma floridae TaxID=7739 RepID=A0A9J7KKF9_BRAFL|nr:lactose-binding lectin l-2-like [Branchiostoma floridae]